MNKAILRIPYDDLLLMIAPRDEWPPVTLKPNTLPAGTAILAVHSNHEHRSIDYVVQHESFPECAKGTRLFVIMAEMRENLADRLALLANPLESGAPIVTDGGAKKG